MTTTKVIAVAALIVALTALIVDVRTLYRLAGHLEPAGTESSLENAMEGYCALFDRTAEKSPHGYWYCAEGLLPPPVEVK